MKILATRDDGAQLIGESDLSCGLLRSDDGSVILPVASILARGRWQDADGDQGMELSAETEDEIRSRSADHDRQLPFS